MEMRKMNLQLFAAESGTVITTDVEPAISIDYTSRIVANIAELQRVLGISDMIPMAAGTQLKIYKTGLKGTIPAQVAEGVTIPLTEIERKVAKTITLGLKKFRKNTTAEAIQKAGREVAINQTDAKLISLIQKSIKADFYTALAAGTGTATGTNLQTCIANMWAQLQIVHEDEDVTPVFFIHPTDAAEYLGSANITVQTAFGMSYLENFMGIGNAIITGGVSAKAPVAVAAENLVGAYAPISGDVGASFGFTTDASGLVGMSHTPISINATIDTLAVTGVAFAPERADAVIVGTIGDDSE